MQNQGRAPNPDVDSFNPDVEPGNSRNPQDEPGQDNSDIESPPDTDTIPLPPDVEKRQPVEEPDDKEEAKRIVDSYN